MRRAIGYHRRDWLERLPTILVILMVWMAVSRQESLLRMLSLDMIVALGQAGPVQVELIQPLTSQCAYRDVVPEGQSGFHHMCVWTHDIEADTAYFEGLGYTAANRGTTGPAQFAYYDTRPLMGCMLEVVTHNEAIVARFAEIARAAEGWNGEDPIRG